MSDREGAARFKIAHDSILKMARLAEPSNKRRQVEICLACAVSIAIEESSSEREAFDAVDALFTCMMSEYFFTDSIAHDEQSKRG